MSADLKCAVDYKRLPLCLTIDHHLYRPLYSLSALNRDRRYHSLSVYPCSKIAGCPTFRFQTHRDARTHTLLHNHRWEWMSGLMPWELELILCLPIWAQQAVLGGSMCISFHSHRPSMSCEKANINLSH